MRQVLRISGMHCGGCVNRVSRALKALGDEVTVTLDPPQAVLDVPAPLPLATLADAVARAGDYEVALVS